MFRTPPPRAAAEPALAKPPAPPPPAESLSFEAAVRELEALVQRMESDELALEDSLVAYKRGAELVRAAQARLEAVEAQVRVLEDGMLKPFRTDAGETG
ncbi:MAG: exodeoxyribonuclease VII small subunit [Burkholderiales bacterium]|nr:exodeoxyribonuclease VII small subunit [Burkholderiales bacterium]